MLVFLQGVMARIAEADLHELLRLTGGDDPLAFRELYERYKETIYLMVKRRVPNEEEARDITQDIFIHLWENRSQLAELQHFDTWLYAIIRNKVVSAYRKVNIRLMGEQYLLDGMAEFDWDAEDMIVAKELYQKIDRIIEELPETTRNCYRLSRNEGKNNNEIAALLNISEKTVRNNISEALKRLKHQLNDHYPELLALVILLHS